MLLPMVDHPSHNKDCQSPDQHVYNACSDWLKAVYGSGHPNTEIKTAFEGIFVTL